MKYSFMISKWQCNLKPTKTGKVSFKKQNLLFYLTIYCLQRMSVGEKSGCT